MNWLHEDVEMAIGLIILFAFSAVLFVIAWGYLIYHLTLWWESRPRK